MIPRESWLRYVRRMTAIQDTAKASMAAYMDANGIADTDSLMGYGYGVATTYGEASAALAAEMYDELAVLAGKALLPAEPAETATFDDVAEAINGVLKKSQSTEMVSASVARLVKLAGADTTLKNAARDGAEFAWVPNGDTCAFCIMLASNGWKKASKKALRGGHAQHIHSNCDCQYAIRFGENEGPAGYDPDKYLAMYENAPLDHWNTPDGKPPPGHEDAEEPKWQNRLNALRRVAYGENAEEINESARSAYAKRRERESSKAEEIDVNG